jgi:hypothetical protein
MATKNGAVSQPKQAAPQEPLTPKLAAWNYVREVWKRHKRVVDELLDAEEEAKDVD